MESGTLNNARAVNMPNVSVQSWTIEPAKYEEVDVEIIKNNMRTVGMTRDQYFELLKQAH